MATGPEDPAGVGRGRVRAGHADREQVIEALQDAFGQGRLTRDELDARPGRALAARTHADLAALTADIPPGPAATGPAAPPVLARRRPLATAAAKSGGCVVIAAAAVWAGALLDPDGPGPNPHHSWAKPFLLVALVAVVTALAILVHGVGTSLEQRRSRGQLPPGPGPGGDGLGGLGGGTGSGPVPHAPRIDQGRVDLRAHQARQRRRHVPARAGRVFRGRRPASGAV